ncbi:MAG: outer membrane beta-barrel protein [Rhodoblastus sp.]|nr:MAG: outer membrane beta-barrel protein [Rhodoblastus sp.]
MIFRLRPAFVLLALCAAPAAFAADMALRPGYGDSAEPAETPAYDWSGPSLGLQGGWTAGSGDKVGLGSTAAQLPSARDLGDLGLRGGSVGLRAGYDVQSPFSHWVAGAAADLTFDGLRRSIDGAGAQGLAVHASARVGWDASLRARVGYAMDRLLIYATAGLATTRENIGCASPPRSSPTSPRPSPSSARPSASARNMRSCAISASGWIPVYGLRRQDDGRRRLFRPDSGRSGAHQRLAEPASPRRQPELAVLTAAPL